jgi:thioredoxin 1
MSSFQQLVSGDVPVLIDFFAEWCGPCKMMTPILQQVRQQLGDQVRILKIDVDKNQQLAASQGVQGVPTLQLYKNGQLLWRQSGVVPAHQLTEIIRQKAL